MSIVESPQVPGTVALQEQSLPPSASLHGQDQEHGCETLAECHSPSSSEATAEPPDQPGLVAQYVRALLEEGFVERALALVRDCCHHPGLAGDPVFLETALVLLTNMGKAEEMWMEVKRLSSMEQLYPTVVALMEYYTPAALLTSEMLLCKELCEKTVTFQDLQQLTCLWVTLLRSQLGDDKDAFEARVLHIGRLIAHEPAFVLNLVRAIRDKVGSASLVLCVNLCLMAFQETPEDPQRNLLDTSRIDANNAALCEELAGLLAADSGLSRLCLLSTFAITPTQELFGRLERAHKTPAARGRAAPPLLSSALSCVLAQCLCGLLPDAIAPYSEWKVLRSKCLGYLRASSLLNVQVRLPDQDVTVRLYVKGADGESPAEGAGGSQKGMGSDGGISEEEEEEEEEEEDAGHNESWQVRTEAKQKWLSQMLWLDMTWRPHWSPEEGQDLGRRTTPAAELPQINWPQAYQLLTAPGQAYREMPPPCEDEPLNLTDVPQEDPFVTPLASPAPPVVCYLEPPAVSSLEPPAVSSLEPSAVSSLDPPAASLLEPTAISSHNPPVVYLEPPAVRALEPPAVSSLEPPAVSSLLPPAVSSLEPPAGSSLEPPAVSSLEPPAVSSLEPPAVSSLLPPAVSFPEPPAGSSLEPPAVSSLEPPAVSALEPPAVSSLELSAVSSLEPPAVSSLETSAVSPLEPPAVSSLEFPAVSYLEPPAVSSLEPLAVSSLEPPAVSSLEPPAVSSVEPPAVSSVKPPAVSSLEPPAVSALEPPAVSALEPPAVSSLEPPVVSSLEPPGVSSLEPPAVSSLEPPAVSSLEPPAVSSLEPPASSLEPPAVSFLEPPAVSSPEPPAVSSLEPLAVSFLEPPAVSSLEPLAVSSVEPPAVSSLETSAVSPLEPNTVSFLEPPAVSSFEPPVVSSLEPLAVISLEPPAVSYLEPTAVSSLEPSAICSLETSAINSQESEKASATPWLILDLDHPYSCPPVRQESAASQQDLENTTQEVHQPNVTDAVLLVRREGSRCDDQWMDWLNFVNAQQCSSDLPAWGSAVSSTDHDCEMRAQVVSAQQGDAIEGAVDRNPEQSARAMIAPECLDEQNDRRGTDSSDEPGGQQTTSSQECVSELPFLRELRVDHKSPAVDISRGVCEPVSGCAGPQPDDVSDGDDSWFDDIDLPSEASSIVGVDVTPDPVTEDGLQWSAIKAIARCQDQESYDQGSDALDLWLSEDSDFSEQISEKLPSSNTSTADCKLPDAKQKLPVVEFTTNRLEARLCALNKSLDALDACNISPRSVRQQPVSLSETTDQVEPLNNSKVLHSLSHPTAEEPLMEQTQSHPQTSNHTPADERETSVSTQSTAIQENVELSKRSSPEQQTTEQRPFTLIDSSHQASNKTLRLSQQSSKNYQQSSDRPASDCPGELSPFRKLALQLSTALKDASARNQTFPPESPGQLSLRTCSPVANGHTESKTPASNPLTSGSNDLHPDARVPVATGTSHRGRLPPATKPNEPATCVTRVQSQKNQTCLRVVKDPVEECGAQPAKQLDKSAISVSPYSKKAPGLSGRNTQEPNARTCESHPDLIWKLDNSTLSNGKLARRRMKGPAESRVDKEIPKAQLTCLPDSKLSLAERAGNLFAATKKEVPTAAAENPPAEASKNLACFRDHVMQGCALKYVDSQAGCANCAKERKAAVGGGSDASRDSDSDCSEFELVQDMNSSSWSVSGKRRTETPPPRKEQRQPAGVPPERARAIKAESSTPPARGKGKESPPKCSEPDGRKSSPAKSPKAAKISHQPRVEEAFTPESAGATRACTSPDRGSLSVSDLQLLPLPAAKVGDPSPPPTARRYNLRMPVPVQGRTKRAYSLRSSALCDAQASTASAKKPRKGSKTPGRPPHGTSTTKRPLTTMTRDTSPGAKKLKDSAQRTQARHAANGGSVAVLANSNGVSDQNNNCSGQALSGRSAKVNGSKTTSTLGDGKPTAAAAAAAAATPTKGQTAAGLAAVTVDRSSPSLPWETKPPLRTYSSKKNIAPMY